MTGKILIIVAVSFLLSGCTTINICYVDKDSGLSATYYSGKGITIGVQR